MAQGDKVLRDMVHSVSLALRVGRKAKPVKTAGDAIRAFATAELRSLAKTDLIASVEECVGARGRPDGLATSATRQRTSC